MKKYWLEESIVFLTCCAFYLIFFVVPSAEGLGKLVRIAFLHIPTAWVSVLAFFLSAWWAARYLKGGQKRADILSAASAKFGFVFVLVATASGAVFSKLTWGAYWNWDPRQTTILLLILLYGAYLTLRASITDSRKRAKAAALYSLFSCLTVPFLVFIIPRLYFSLHPTPVINADGRVDMDSIMAYALAVAVLDATLIYAWLMRRAVKKELEAEHEP